MRNESIGTWTRKDHQGTIAKETTVMDQKVVIFDVTELYLPVE